MKRRLLNIGCGQRFHAAWVNVDYRPPTGGVRANVGAGLPFADDRFEAVYHSHVLEHLPRPAAAPFLAECMRVLSPGGVLRVGVPDLEQIARLYLDKLDRVLGGDCQAESDYDWMMLEMYDQTVRDRPGGMMAEYLALPDLPNAEFVIKRIGEEGRRIIARARAASSSPAGPSCRACPAVDARSVDERALAMGRFRMSGEIHQWMYDRYSLGRALSRARFVAPRVMRPGESTIEGFAAYGLELDSEGLPKKPDTLFMEAVKLA